MDSGLVVRHEEYYHDDGNVVLLIGNTLYKLHKSILSRNSAHFRSMFSLPQAPDTLEGTCDEQPITVPHCKSHDFERLMSLVYASPETSVTGQARTLDDWKAILEAARLFQVEWIHERAFQEMSRFPLDPIEKVVLAQRFEDKRSWVRDAYVALVRRNGYLSVEEAQQIGLVDSVKLSQAREIFREQLAHMTPTAPSGPMSSSRIGWGRRSSLNTARQAAAPYPNPHQGAGSSSSSILGWGGGNQNQQQQQQQHSLAQGLVAASLGTMVAPAPVYPAPPYAQQQMLAQAQATAQAQAVQAHLMQQHMNMNNPQSAAMQQPGLAAGLAGSLGVMISGAAPHVQPAHAYALSGDADEIMLAERVVDMIFGFNVQSPQGSIPSPTPTT